MLRIGKLTDYGILLLTYFAKESEGVVLQARDLSKLSNLPYPTVGKILKILCRGHILQSQRGVKGGYRLARPAEEVSISEVVILMEGPIAITECGGSFEGLCNLDESCPLRYHWQVISKTVSGALDKLNLKDMIAPLTPRPSAIETPMISLQGNP